MTPNAIFSIVVFFPGMSDTKISCELKGHPKTPPKSCSVVTDPQV